MQDMDFISKERLKLIEAVVEAARQYVEAPHAEAKSKLRKLIDSVDALKEYQERVR